jgi:hypothetical protein
MTAPTLSGAPRNEPATTWLILETDFISYYHLSHVRRTVPEHHSSPTTLSLRNVLGHGIVHVAVAPVLARLGGLDHFMPYIPVVLGSMLAYG